MFNSLNYNLSRRNQQNLETLATKVIVFTFPERIQAGRSLPEIRFPYKGVTSNLTFTSQDKLEREFSLQVQKINEESYRQGRSDWQLISHVILPEGVKFGQEPVTEEVNKGDIFRVFFTEGGLKGITIELSIVLDFV